MEYWLGNETNTPVLQYSNLLTDSYLATLGLCHPPAGETLCSTSGGPQLPGS